MKVSNIQQQKIKRFLGDPEMEQAVFQVLFQSFIKKEKREDVNLTAARTIAIDLLQDAWKELETQRAKVDVEPTITRQPGL